MEHYRCFQFFNGTLCDISCCGFSFFSGDETFNDVFKDFSHMASENPEKLKRKENQDQ